MMEYFEYIVYGFVVGIVIGWYAREYRAKLYLHRVEKMMNQSFGTMVAEAAKNVVEIIVSRQGDMFYVHDKVSGTFLAQGQTHDEIANILNNRFPEATFMADPADLEKIGYTK